MPKGRGIDRNYDVCLSFAGEDRAYAETVARILTARGIRVFYDKYETVGLWGKNLYDHLEFVYRDAARFCVMFVSRHYAKKHWTNHERRSAFARALKDPEEYILPVRLDETEIKGLPETVGYLSGISHSPKDIATSIYKKIGPSIFVAQLQTRPDFVDVLRKIVRR
jgi:hypothetical protein